MKLESKQNNAEDDDHVQIALSLLVIEPFKVYFKYILT